MFECASEVEIFFVVLVHNLRFCSCMWTCPRSLVELLEGVTIKEKRSKFVGHCAAVYQVRDAVEAVQTLLLNKKYAEATHNIWVYRLQESDGKVWRLSNTSSDSLSLPWNLAHVGVVRGVSLCDLFPPTSSSNQPTDHGACRGRWREWCKHEDFALPTTGRRKECGGHCDKVVW